MHAAEILEPCFALVLLTAIVWFTVLLRRVAHLKRESAESDGSMQAAAAKGPFTEAPASNSNLINLFELPVLFYVSSLLILQLAVTDWIFLALGWIFVLLRAVHTAIQLTYNDFIHRSIVYLLSAMVLWSIWLRIAHGVYMGF